MTVEQATRAMRKADDDERERERRLLHRAEVTTKRALRVLRRELAARAPAGAP